MYGYFKESHPGFTCSEVTYRRQILSKYISNWGEEVCETHLVHECNGSFNISEIPKKKDSTEECKSIITEGLCEVCDDWLHHIERANKSREEYRNDAN